MKKRLFLIVLFSASYVAYSQDAKASSCDKSSCGPEGTKKGEAVVITTMRNDLQSVISKMSKSGIYFDREISGMQITKGSSDDECLLYISQAASAIRHELLNKLESAKLIASLKNYKPETFSNKQKMVSGLKKEIEILTAQAEKL